MGKKEREKGKRGERELATRLKELGIEARRGQQFQGSPDSPDLITNFDDMWHIECKRVEALSIYPAMEKAEEDAGQDQFPVVMHRRNGKPWIATVHLVDFVNLVKKANAWEQLVEQSGDKYDEQV